MKLLYFNAELQYILLHKTKRPVAGRGPRAGLIRVELVLSQTGLRTGPTRLL